MKSKQHLIMGVLFHVKNLHATIPNQLEFHSDQLTDFYDGLEQSLVGVEGAEPIRQITATGI